MKREYIYTRRMIKHLSFMALTALGIMCFSCQHQSLEDPSFYTASIPITIDWSESTVDVKDINNVSATFYPQDGSEPFVQVSGDPHLFIAKLKEGVYDIILHNEMTDNIKGIDCFDNDSFDDFRMMIQRDNPANYTMFYKPEKDARMIKESESIGGWQYKELTVSRELIKYTRTTAFEELLKLMRNRSKMALTMIDSKSVASYITKGYVDALNNLPQATYSITNTLKDLTEIKPQPRTINYNVSIEIENMNNIQSTGFEGIIDGFVDGVRIFDGEKIVASNPNYSRIPYITNSIKPVYKADSDTDGFVNYEFTNIGHLQYVEGANYTLHLNIILHNGEKRTFVRDITNQIQNYTIGTTIDILIGESFNNETETVVLPENAEGGFGVGDWDDAQDVPL